MKKKSLLVPLLVSSIGFITGCGNVSSSGSDVSSSLDSEDAGFISSSTSSDITSSSISSEEETVYHTVTFDSNGGSNVPNSRVKHGDKLVKPENPIREGYEFQKWVNSLNEEWLFNEYVITEDITLTASWLGNEYNVNLSSDQHGKVSGGGKYRCGDNVTITALANDGYAFVAWVDEDTNIISESSTYSFVVPPKDVNYRAIFEEETYTVTVISEDEYRGSVTGGGKFSYGSYTLIDAKANTGFEFNGWYIDGVKYSNSHLVRVNVTKSVTYVAKFKMDPSTFGRYPSSQVRDDRKISELNSMVGTPGEEGWTPYEWYMNGSTDTKYAWYIDLDIDGDGKNDYRGVYFNSHRDPWAGPTRLDLGVDTIGEAPQHYNKYYEEVTYWFEYEPMAWSIVSMTEDDVFLVSNAIIDSWQFYRSVDEGYRSDYQGNYADADSNNYKYSDLRTFLNVSFYETAFNDYEKAFIKTTQVDNSIESTGFKRNGYACEVTEDKVFAPSYSEVCENGVFGWNSDSVRAQFPTNYARCMGVMTCDEHLCNAYYWLRSPDDDKARSQMVRCTGEIVYNGAYVTVTYAGVLPAMHLSRSI